jgi:hypothetical protein
MGRPFKIGKFNTSANVYVDIGVPSQIEVGNIGQVGGNVANVLTLLVQANINYNGASYAQGNSYIVRQKGEYKYLVANTANSAIQGICYVVNIDGGNVANLTGGQMAIIATNSANANVTIAKLQNRFLVAYANQTGAATAKANTALGNGYFGSFVAANATVQPGGPGATPSGPDGGGGPGGGLYPIVKLPSF